MNDQALWQEIVQATVDLLEVVSWPVVVGGGILFLASKRGARLFAGLTGRVRAVSAGGISVELTEEAAAELKADLEEVFVEYRRQATVEFDRLAHVHQVRRLRDEVARRLIEPRTKDKAAFRCTVYVPDILFDDALYCLLDYFPKGAARGRTYSMRFGIIGRTWRLEKSIMEKRVSGDPSELITSWGMTAVEAADAHNHDQAFLCVVLRVGGQPVGILFADAEPGAFQDGLAGEIEAADLTQELARAVRDTTAALRQKGPALKVFDA